MERDVASLRKQHRAKLLVLHDQIARMDNNNNTQDNQGHSERTAESQKVPSKTQIDKRGKSLTLPPKGHLGGELPRVPCKVGQSRRLMGTSTSLLGRFLTHCSIAL